MFVPPTIAERVGVRKAYPTGDALPRSSVLRATMFAGLTVRGGIANIEERSAGPFSSKAGRGAAPSRPS